MDVELKEYLENLNIRISELKISIDNLGNDLRKEFNEKLNSLESRFDARLEAFENRFDARLEAFESRFDAKLESLENRIDEKLDAKTEEFKRYVGVMCEEFHNKICLVIEGQEIICREMNEFKQENTREHKELHAMIKLTYSDLNYRLKSLESLHNN